MQAATWRPLALIGRFVAASWRFVAAARRFALGGLVLGLLAGCLTPAQQRQESLARVSREFSEGLRWGRYDRLTAHLSPEDARLFFERVSYVGNDLAMADSEVTAVKVDENAERATVRTEISWYSQRKALLRSATLEQEWQWSQGRWVCVQQKRVRGDRFPLVPEPLSSGGEPAPAPTTSASPDAPASTAPTAPARVTPDAPDAPASTAPNAPARVAPNAPDAPASTAPARVTPTRPSAAPARVTPTRPSAAPAPEPSSAYAPARP